MKIKTKCSEDDNERNDYDGGDVDDDDDDDNKFGYQTGQ